MTIRLRYQWMLLAAVVLGVYYPAIFGGYYVVDDVNRLNRLVNIENFDFYHLFFRNSGYYYRPIIASTFYLDQIVWGGEAIFMHVENLLIHLLNASLVFALARRLCRQADHLPTWLPLLMAFFFALHPVNAEAVCWISGRYDLLATTFVLTSVSLLLWALSGTSVWRMLPAIIFALLGCLAKETALFYFGGAVCLLVAHARQKNDGFVCVIRSALPGFFLWTAGVITYLALRSWGLSGKDTGVKTVLNSVETTSSALDWADQLRIAVKVSGFYFKKILVPYPLNFAISEISHFYLLVGFILVLIILWLVWRADMPSAFFLASLLTCSAALLVVFGKMAWTLVAERYLYMPSVFFTLGLISWAANCGHPKKLAAFKVLMICVVIVWSGMTIQRAKIWSDPVALAEDTVAKSPAFIPARKDLANYYLAIGEKEKGQRLLEGIMDSKGDVSFIPADISMALSLIEADELEKAHQVLAEVLQKPGKQLVKVSTQILDLNRKRLSRTTNELARRQIHRENVSLLETLKKNSNDPFLDYRMAKEYLALEEMGHASALFESTCRRASISSYYREPACKLAHKLVVEKND